ncbi:hypothetical protein [Brunnivagina elsteri]|uniref:hypothetical protein n=1 Tax=Brunnivagina elsteri TaxID=1247191 RepID=UPI00130445F0|nr:hypothetical protein [Calothrix elsteri]
MGLGFAIAIVSAHGGKFLCRKQSQYIPFRKGRVNRYFRFQYGSVMTTQGSEDN